MKTLIITLSLLVSISSYGHEGHGEMPTEPSKFGGILGNVVDEAKVGKKTHNHPKLKAEIVRSEDGTVRLYLFDLKMKQLKTEGFGKQVQASVENHKAKTKDKFTLEAQGDHFIGKMPKQKKKPFDIYITLNRGNEKLFVAFDNLD